MSYKAQRLFGTPCVNFVVVVYLHRDAADGIELTIFGQLKATELGGKGSRTVRTNHTTPRREISFNVFMPLAMDVGIDVDTNGFAKLQRNVFVTSGFLLSQLEKLSVVLQREQDVGNEI